MNRRSIRLKGYDYSRPGAYFVTLCTRNRKCLFGQVVNKKMKLNDMGLIAEKCWNEMPSHFPHVRLDEFIVMPNHIHGILIITPVGAKNFSPIAANTYAPVETNNYSPLRVKNHSPHRPRGTSKTIGSVIRGFKIGVTKWCRKKNRQNIPYSDTIKGLWQRNYFDHIIRDDEFLNRIREYIIQNPMQWEFDRENPIGANSNLPPGTNNHSLVGTKNISSVRANNDSPVKENKPTPVRAKNFSPIRNGNPLS